MARSIKATPGPPPCHSFRHPPATRLLERGYHTRTVQELLGDKNVTATTVYTHVLNQGGKEVRRPTGRLPSEAGRWQDRPARRDVM